MTNDEKVGPGVVNAIARVCHEANRGWQMSVPAEGVPVAIPWDDFSAVHRDQAEGVRQGVRNTLAGATPDENHENWCRAKFEDGWTLGPVKDIDAKTHPCLVPRDALPLENRIKDDLFHAIVHALAPAFGITISASRAFSDTDIAEAQTVSWPPVGGRQGTG